MTTGDNSEEIVYDMSPKTKVTINDSLVEYDAIINDANEWQKNIDEIILIRKDIFNIEFGDYINHDNKTFLIKHEIEDRDFFWTGKMQLCNNTIILQTGTTKTISGYDPMGRPIYAEIPIDSTFPAIVQSRLYLTENNEQVNIPDGRLHVTVKYNDTIKKGMTFTMYGDKYQINGIDYSNTINGKGTITLFADMV